MAYVVSCRECNWSAAEPVDLKGMANWLAGRHISDAGHSVGIDQIDSDLDTDEPSSVDR